MSALPPHITTDLISDYVAGRLDAEQVAVIDKAKYRNEAVAAAVTAARQLNSRIGRYFSNRAAQCRN